MTVTFLGHRDAPLELRKILEQTVERLIAEEEATRFYVGHQGAFDRMAAGVLREAAQRHRHIRWFIVLAYLPTTDGAFDADTLYPEGLETVPPRFAIGARNEWMIGQADTVVTYVVHQTGGAARYAARAQKRGRRMIALAAP